MELYTMSIQELSRLEVIRKVVCRELKQQAASELLDISVRQVQRLIRGYRLDGPIRLISKKRGKLSNNRLSGEIKDRIISLISSHYSDFGPTLACEKLAERHGINVSVETVRGLMIEAELWISRHKRLKRAYQPRNRRSCYGELIQIDGSLHAWFEDRGPKCSLLVYIDDATSRLMTLYFAPSESTHTYFLATERYIQQHGKPIAFYSDKLGVFHVYKQVMQERVMTQFGRGLYELNIDLICAHTPQAKGRVERANKTLQDRLVKELRLRGISTIEAANAYMHEFITGHNQRFAKPPVNDVDVHRSLQPHESLKISLCFKQQRTVTYNLTIQHDRVQYLIEDSEQNRLLRREKIELHEYPDGSIELFHDGRRLAFRKLYDRVIQEVQGDIVPNKRIEEILTLAKAMQQLRPITRSSRALSKRHLNFTPPAVKQNISGN